MLHNIGQYVWCLYIFNILYTFNVLGGFRYYWQTSKETKVFYWVQVADIIICKMMPGKWLYLFYMCWFVLPQQKSVSENHDSHGRRNHNGGKGHQKFIVNSVLFDVYFIFGVQSPRAATCYLVIQIYIYAKWLHLLNYELINHNIFCLIYKYGTYRSCGTLSVCKQKNRYGSLKVPPRKGSIWS